MKIWILFTCIPSESRPCWPEVFVDESEARATFEDRLREEWKYNGPEGDDGKLPFPEDAELEEINDTIGEAAGAEWGEWQLSSHELENYEKVLAE